MALERVDVINRALVRIGEAPVQFADTETEESDPLVWTYETRVENALGVYPWRCTLVTRQLTLGTLPALTPWTKCYPVPVPRIGNPRALWKATTMRDDERIKQFEFGLDASNNLAVLCDEDLCIATYQRRPAPQVWDPPVLELITLDLMAAYAWQVSQDKAKHDSLIEQAWGSTESRVTGQFFKAKNAEATVQATKVMTLESGPLVAARY